MTEEEIEKQAEEYTRNCCVDMTFDIHNIRKAFQDGAKWGMEHTIEWHDLRKDPTDLPKEKGYYLVAIKNCFECTICYFSHSEMKFNIEEVIAWCELPQFKDKE